MKNARDDSVLCIGNFDGCHIGHQALLRQGRELASKLSLKFGVLSFDPPPELFFSGSSKPRLSSRAQKERIFRALGADFVRILTFDHALASLSPEDFVQKYLIEQFHVVHTIVGFDFKFGKNRAGDVTILKTLGNELGFEVHAIDAVATPGSRAKAASRNIRKALEDGDVSLAQILLGRPYCIEGVVQPGLGKGQNLGFPTINLSKIEQQIPRNGVYCGWVCLDPNDLDLIRLDACAHKAVFNIGLAPTMREKQQLFQIEAHLLDVDWGSLRQDNKRALYYFKKFLRDEKKFSDIASLKAQIGLDIENARASL